ncbi:hypothetical protein BDR26DRAFT_920198 [Obelidium mucronatum]|nr:hypothetical protein BDR26DRAFT_920198 [Obelidium mucronatum]
MSTERLSVVSKEKKEKSSNSVDIWSLALKAKKNGAAGVAVTEDGVETTLMVVGNKQAGKSSLVHRLQNKDDLPAPTTALEYRLANITAMAFLTLINILRFARSTRGTVKDVAHIWELAGGAHLTDLIDIPVSESNIHLTTFVIVIDLSTPEEAMSVLEHFLDKIQTRSKKVLDGLEARGSKRPKGLRSFAVKKYGAEHPDISNNAINICPIPIVIVGSKYDLFRDLEPEKRKLFCKTLRFLAHTNGASLVFANLKDESSCAKLRRVLNHHIFRSSPLQELSQDYNKPLVITPGQDTFSQIGLPPSEAGQQKDAVGKQPFASYDKWRNDFDRYFPPKKDASNKIEKIDFSKYVEPRVDTMRAQKDEEFERMRRNETKKIPIKELLSQVAGTQQKSTSNPMHSHSQRGQAGRAKTRAAAAGAKSNTSQIKTLSDLVKSLVKRQTAPKTRASRLWAKLRDHVKRGFFASLLNETEPLPASFLTNIEKLWTLVHKHSSEAYQRRNAGANDSTTEFVMAGWAKIKEAQFAAARTKAKGSNYAVDVNSSTANIDGNNAASNSRIHSVNDVHSQGQESSQEELDQEAEVVSRHRKSRDGLGALVQQVSQRSGLGIEGLSFDTVPNISVTSELRIIAEGLYSQPLIEADYFTVQVNFNRGWKLLLLGLTQAESLGRYMAMCALKIAIPVINDTLLDSSTRQNLMLTLVNLMVSDCRKENRLKAIYLIGIIAQQLGIVREHDVMLLKVLIRSKQLKTNYIKTKVFKELVKKLLEIQFKERTLVDGERMKFQTENRSLKIYLIYALGKFTSNLSQNSRYMEDLTVYSLANEFEYGDTKLQIKSDGTLKKNSPTGPLFVVKALLGVLVNDVKHTEQNEKYVGAIFKSFVSPLLKVATQGVQMQSVQFVSNWLPVTNEDNALLALDALQSGLKLIKDLGVPNFDKLAYDREMSIYKRKMIAEESRIALRSKLLKQLIMIPGTYSKLLPVTDHPGFFADNNSTMFNTKAIAVGLPIHPKSNVLISRPIPNIPGVPTGVTTIPPVFMEPTWFEKIPIPQDYYDASERIGAIPGLPIGYTYVPTKLVDVYTIRGIEKPKKDDSAPNSKNLKLAPQASRKSRVSKISHAAANSAASAAAARPSSGSHVHTNITEEDDTMADIESPIQAPGFGFVKRRGTLTRIDVERSGDNLEVLPIPTGTTRQMPKEDGVRFESMQRGDGLIRDSKAGDKNQSVVKKMPPGFLAVSQFPGFDPDLVDRSGIQASAIYHESNEDEMDLINILNKPPTGFTFDKNPILWPNKKLTLKSVPYTTDFPMHSPVLFDIIQPGSSMLQQILCQVVGIDRDVSAVSVQSDSSSNLLSAGATFNLFIRNRSSLTKWTCINLQVVDEDYRESSLSQRQRSITATTKSLNSVYAAATNAGADGAERSLSGGAVVPSGFTSSGDAYFPPPVTIPPIPAGYTPDMVPYYGRSAAVKPQPLGVTTDGIRFYNTDGTLSEGQRNAIGGYDNTGQPFFIPKGCQLPVPVGFTPDGIPYFDIASILNQKGIMMLPVPKKNRTLWPTFPEEDDSIIQIEVAPDGKSIPKKVTPAMLLDDLLTQLKITQAEITKTLVANRTHAAGTVKRLKDYSMDVAESIDTSDDPAVLDPEDIVQFLKDSDEFAHLRPAQIRVQMDPVTMEFQSVHSPVTKNVVLRYRANRGDHEERDFFVSVEPVDVFTIPTFHMKLQGEGMTQIAVTFNPIALHSERIDGSLSLIDETGKRLVSCGLVALRQSFIKITPSSIDAGWMLPDKRKEVLLKIENLSSIPVTLTFELSSEANARAAVVQAAAMLKIQGGNSESVNETHVDEMKKRGFSIPQRAAKLQPSESKMVAVHFEPSNIGRFTDGIEVTAPGGDLVRVNLEGVAGIPIALYPENAENSQAGGLALTPERTEFMKKFRKSASKEKVHTPLTDIDISILQNMMSASADPATRRMAHTVDFGICNPVQSTEVLRCVTIMNLSDNTVSIGLFPHISAIKCKYSVKIPPRSATTVEIVLNLAECVRGNIKSAIEVICPEFQNIPFMLSDDETKYERVLAFGGYPVTFTFTARQRGPWMKSISFKLGKLFGGVSLPTCPSGYRLTLAGLCIEPYPHLPGATPDKNSLELMRLWMSHPKRVLDEYAQHDGERSKRFQLVNFDGRYIPRGNAEDLDISFLKDEVVFRQKSRGEDPMAQRRAQGAQEITDVMFVPPPNLIETVTVYGFAAILSDEDHKYHTIQMVGRPVSDFLVFPPCDADGNLILDFGRVETSTTTFEINTKWIILLNTFPHSYSWNIKFTSSKTKFNPFDASMGFGELESNDNFPIPFNFRCDTTGAFESIAEISIKDAMDRSSKPIRVANVILRANSVNTSITGFPDTLDFGSTVVFHKKRQTFKLTNNGTTDTKVSLYCRGPFSISPKSFEIYPKGTQEVTITFAPTESRTYSSKIQIFANQRLYMIQGLGSCGTSDLVCEMYGSKDIDFGVQKEGTIAWISVYLTNKGTLPLTLNAVTASRPDLIKLEYCDVTSTVPFTSTQGNKTLVAVRRNYWGILQRKFQVYVMLKGLRKANNLVTRDFSKPAERRKDAFIVENGVVVPVSKDDPSFNPVDETLFPVVPELRPFYSYHFRVGYLNKYQPNKDTDVTFHYMPITTHEDESSLPGLLKDMSVHITGTVFRPLEFFPSSFDFGLTPVEIFQENSWHSDISHEVGQKKLMGPFSTLQVLNMSLEAQNLTLDFISSEFKISGKTWCVNPGEKLLIPVEFHPPKEQTQFRGEARFRHSNEKQIVVLTGTGASADVVADETVDFGSVKLGSDSWTVVFILDIIQKGNDFCFTDEEPYEYEGIITSGTAELIEIECCCESMVSNKAHISIRWEKVPGGAWQHLMVPLLVQTGLPVFRLTSIELDFKTTYINVNKSLEFSVTNDGNASCYWALESCPSILKVSPDTGVIPAGGTMFIEVEFAPVDFEQLVAELGFYTDAGRKTLMCYGLVGVPYLNIPQEHLTLDFGITAVDKAQTKTMTMTNTGSKPIHYEIVISKMLEDGVETGSDMEIFFVQPANGTILPGTTQNILIRAIPKHYGSVITAKYVISTKDGERYIGNAKVTGGRAIIKIAPPTFVSEDGSVENKAAEVTEDQSKSMAEAKRTALFEMTRLAFQSHIENLQDVLSGLRTEDIEAFETALKAQKQASRAQGGKVTAAKATPPAKGVSGRMSPSRPEGSAKTAAMSPKKKRDLQMLQRAEIQLQERLGGEEGRRKAASGTVFDGSDLRAKVNRALELAHSRGYQRGSARSRPQTEPNGKPGVVDATSRAIATAASEKAGLDSAESKSEKFLSDLASLESDLEVLSTIVKSVNSSSMESLASTPSSGSSLNRYHAGSRKKSRRTKSMQPSRGVQPDSQGGVEVYDALDSPGTEVDEFGNPLPSKRAHASKPDGGFVSSQMEGESGSDIGRTPTSGTSSQQDAKSTSSGSSKPQTRDTLLRRSLASQRANRFPTVPARTDSNRTGGSSNVLSESERNSLGTGGNGGDSPSVIASPLEDLVRLAHYYSSLVNTNGDPELQQELVEEINNQLMSSTKGVIKLVKEQLSNSWVPNREFLSAALRQVQQSNHVMEALKATKPSKSGPVANDFNLGLVRSGDLLSDVKLFNLPNLGNLSLDFVIKRNTKMKLRPTEFPESDEPGLFLVNPMEGVLEPGAAINFVVTFLTRTPGFYQQGYDLESGGEKVISFSITAMSGIPMIVVEPSLIEFGLVCRNKFDIRSLVITNTGSFKDIWRLDSIKSRGGNGDIEEELFSPNITEGNLDPRKSVTVDFKFSPKEEGNFSKRYRVLWTGEPRLVEVKGIGGGARLKCSFVEADDVKYKCLDWGTTIVGLSYTKELIVQNVGNIEGFFHLTHANILFRFEYPADTNGNCRLDSGASITVKIHFSPIYSEKISDPLQVHLMDSPVQSIPLRLIAGTKIWAIEGDANFKNMSIKDTQTVKLAVLNAGTLSIPFNYRLELTDPEMEQYFKISLPHLKGKPFPGTINLAAEKEIFIEVTITPKKDHRTVTGKLVLITELGPGPDSAEFPFDFWTYDKQLALDDSKDVSVGRVLVGETVDVGRQLTNFGSEKVKYRIRIEPIERIMDSQTSIADDPPELKGGGKKKGGAGAAPLKLKRKAADPKSIPWKVRDPTEGYLEPNMSLGVSVAFESLPENGDAWQDARLVVEKCDDEGKNLWSELSSMKLTGAAGTPKLALSEDELDFGVVGKGIAKTHIVTLHNKGNALLSYDFETGWDYSGNIYFENEELISGKIVAGASVEVSLVFKPDNVMDYSTILFIKTQLDKKTILIKGTGALYKFHKESIPTVLNFGTIFVGDQVDKKLTIHNDCIYAISVESKMMAEEYAFVDPELIDIAGNKTAHPTDIAARSSSDFTVTIKSPLSEKDSSDEVESTQLEKWCSKVATKCMLDLRTLGGDAETGSYSIPVTFKFNIHDIVLISTVKYASIKKGESQYEESDMVKHLDYGEVGYENGASMNICLYNRNSFKVSLNAKLSDGSKFTVFPVKTTVAPRSVKEFRIELKVVDVEEGGELASSMSVKDHLKITSPLALLSELDVDLLATLIDEPDTLDFSQPIEFEPVRRLFQGTTHLEFRNPVRRSLAYKFTVDPNFKDIFFFDRGESIFSGTAKPRANVSVPIHFHPKIGIKYSVDCALETDEKNFLLTLVGTGVEPSLALSTDKVNFGIVGVGAAEFQTITATNNSLVVVKFCVSVSGSETFSVEEACLDEITLEPGQEQVIKVICNPHSMSEQAKAQLEFINLDKPPNAKKVPPFGFVALESIGGKCEFRFAPSADGDVEMETEEDTDPVYDEHGNLIPKTPTIFVNFTKVIQGQRVRKYFEVENCGDTMIDLVMTDVMGREAKEDIEMASEKTAFTFSPVNVVIKPRTKQKFAVIAKGLKVGEDVHYVHVRTRTHMEARIIPIRIKTNILSPESQLADGLKVFARADNSIEGLLAVKGPSDASMNSDLDLWKIYIPIIRVSLDMPSQELQFVPPLTPNTSLPDISSFVVRPPALPKEVTQKAKKWYVNRTSMALDQTNVLTPNTDARRRAALDWVRPVEKQVYLEKNSRRGRGNI